MNLLDNNTGLVKVNNALVKLFASIKMANKLLAMNDDLPEFISGRKRVVSGI